MKILCAAAMCENRVKVAKNHEAWPVYCPAHTVTKADLADPIFARLYGYGGITAEADFIEERKCYEKSIARFCG